jgi:hypothetical protein
MSDDRPQRRPQRRLVHLRLPRRRRPPPLPLAARHKEGTASFLRVDWKRIRRPVGEGARARAIYLRRFSVAAVDWRVWKDSRSHAPALPPRGTGRRGGDSLDEKEIALWCTGRLRFRVVCEVARAALTLTLRRSARRIGLDATHQLFFLGPRDTA